MQDTHPITRVDLYARPDGVFVAKYPRDWTASTPPAKSYVITDHTLDELAAQLEQTPGWRVRRWPGGARGWLGKLAPVRTRSDIIRKREELTRWRPAGVEVHALDLAFDW